MKFSRPPLRNNGVRYSYLVLFFNVFLILLIIVILLPDLLMPAGLTVALPRVITSEPVSQKGPVVSILKDNTIYLDSRKISLSELKDFLASRQNQKFQVLIKADKEARIGVLVDVWNLFREIGASKVSIATNE